MSSNRESIPQHTESGSSCDLAHPTSASAATRPELQDRQSYQAAIAQAIYRQAESRFVEAEGGTVPRMATFKSVAVEMWPACK